MALLDFEGFDRETANLNMFTNFGGSIGSDGGGVFGYGRFWSTTNGEIRRESWFPATEIIYFQAHAWGDGGYNNTGLQFQLWRNTTAQLYVRFLSGVIEVYRGDPGTLIGSVAYAHPVNIWFFVQIRARIHPSNGSVEVRVNGVTVLSLTGVNTSASGHAEANGWRIRYAGVPTCRVDNIVLYDESGDAPTTWTPETRIYEVLPTAAGGTTEWTPSAGANWQCVDEQPSNGDTDYVSASSAPLTDTYAAAASVAAGALVYGVGVHATARKDDAGTNSIDGVLRVSSTNYARGSPASITNSYGRYRWLWTKDPSTGLAWTVSAANSAQPGIRRTA